MKPQTRLPQFLVLLLGLALFLAACERPLQRSTSPAPPTTESATAVPTNVPTTVPTAVPTNVPTNVPTTVPATPTTEQVAAAPAATATTMPEPTAAPTATATPEAAAEEAAAEEASAEEAAATEDKSPRAGEETTSGSEGGQENAGTEEQPVAEEPAPAAKEAARPETHTVAAGENLYRIGLLYNVSWVTLAQYNELPNANAIVVGQLLRIPPAPGTEPGATPPEEQPPAGETIYTVEPGDNLYRIGLKFGVNWVQIAEANGIVNPNQITVGQQLKIPTDTPGPAPQFTHIVSPNETLFLISVQYGVPWPAIAGANDLESPYVIFPGQTLIIPGSK